MVSYARHQESEDESLLSVREILQTLWRRAWIIVAVALLMTAAAVGFSLLQTPQYESSIMILVGQDQGISEDPTQATGLQTLTQTVSEGVATRPVADDVIQQFGLQTTADGFLANLGVEQVTNTQFIEVTYTDPDPQQAQEVANTVGSVFAEQIAEVSPSANAITATVWEEAVAAEDPASPNPLRNGGLALALGLMLGVGLAFLLEQLDDSWRSPEETEEVSGVPTFGVIREFDVSSPETRGGSSP